MIMPPSMLPMLWTPDVVPANAIGRRLLGKCEADLMQADAIPVTTRTAISRTSGKLGNRNTLNQPAVAMHCAQPVQRFPVANRSGQCAHNRSGDCPGEQQQRGNHRGGGSRQAIMGSQERLRPRGPANVSVGPDTPPEMMKISQMLGVRSTARIPPSTDRRTIEHAARA